jgi:hypothetical protein
MATAVTLGMLTKEAAKLGAVVREEKGGWLDCRIEAPHGKVWACDGDIHELVGSCNNGPKEWGYAMRADLLYRMRHGLLDCPIADCEWCNPEEGE